MSKKSHQNYFAPSFPISSLEIDGYKISYEDHKDSLNTFFSQKERIKFQDLLHEAQIHPKLAYPKALEWQSTVQDSKELDNLITYLHLQNRQLEKAENLTLASFQKYPDYLFAKINYADQCLRKNKIDQIPLIFPSFNLKELLPKRTSFHVSEFRGFMMVASHYHLKIKQFSLAKHYYENARLADPLHPTVLFAEKTFHKKNILLKFFYKIVRLAHIP
ncbi:MAG: hypothetical protein V4489_04210 [Chlamydiota bacterium]